MLDSCFEFRISTAGRQELTALADEIGVTAADVIRLGIRRVAAEQRRARARGAAMPVAAPPPPPPSAPSFESMSMTTLQALRDGLGQQTTPEASRTYVEVHTEIMKREMKRRPE